MERTVASEQKKRKWVLWVTHILGQLSSDLRLDQEAANLR